MPYYPAQTFILPLTTIRRERRLPSGAYGDVVVREDQRVEAQDIVLRGSLPGDYMILDALEPLGLKKPEQFTEDMLTVPVGQVVDKGTVIASNGKGRGAKVLRAPAEAVVARESLSLGSRPRSTTTGPCPAGRRGSRAVVAQGPWCAPSSGRCRP